MSEVLCQNCLRVRPYTQDRHNGDEKCVCGGDYCGCEGCEQAIRELRDGVKRPYGFLVDVKSWTADKGAA